MKAWKTTKMTITILTDEGQNWIQHIRNKSGFFQHLCFLPYTFPLCYGILFVKAGF